jgi:hypothetical protein
MVTNGNPDRQERQRGTPPPANNLHNLAHMHGRSIVGESTRLGQDDTMSSGGRSYSRRGPAAMVHCLASGYKLGGTFSDAVGYVLTE